MWTCFQEPYIGAAHGVVGILAMLFRCFEHLTHEGKQLVSSTLSQLLSIRYRLSVLSLCLCSLVVPAPLDPLHVVSSS